MNESKTLTYELLRNTASNFILYMIIFTLFSGLLYYQVDSYIYSTADKGLAKVKSDWTEAKKRKDFEDRLEESINSPNNNSENNDDSINNKNE